MAYAKFSCRNLVGSSLPRPTLFCFGLVWSNHIAGKMYPEMDIRRTVNSTIPPFPQNNVGFPVSRNCLFRVQCWKGEGGGVGGREWVALKVYLKWNKWMWQLTLDSVNCLNYCCRPLKDWSHISGQRTFMSSMARLNCCCWWACCSLEPLSADLLTSSFQPSFNLLKKSLISLEP